MKLTELLNNNHISQKSSISTDLKLLKSHVVLFFCSSYKDGWTEKGQQVQHEATHGRDCDIFVNWSHRIYYHPSTFPVHFAILQGTRREWDIRTICPTLSKTWNFDRCSSKSVWNCLDGWNFGFPVFIITIRVSPDIGCFFRHLRKKEGSPHLSGT